MMQIAESSVQAGNRGGCDVPWHDKLIAADRWEPLMTVNSIYSSVVGSLVGFIIHRTIWIYIAHVQMHYHFPYVGANLR